MSQEPRSLTIRTIENQTELIDLYRTQIKELKDRIAELEAELKKVQNPQPITNIEQPKKKNDIF